MAFKFGVVRFGFVWPGKALPPKAKVYHLKIELVPVPEAFRVTVPGPHLEESNPVGGLGTGLILAIILTLELWQNCEFTET